MRRPLLSVLGIRTALPKRTQVIVYWGLTGIFVPLFLILVNHLLSLLHKHPYWLDNLFIFFWPTSLFLTVLHGQSSVYNVIFVYILSIGFNVMIYSVIGSIFLLRGSAKPLKMSESTAFDHKIIPLKNKSAIEQGSHTARENVAGYVKIISIVYGMCALVYIPLINILFMVLFTKENFIVKMSPFVAIINFIVCLIISGMFWNLNRVGRYLAIGHNGIWLTISTVGFISLIIRQRYLFESFLPVLLLLFIAFPISMIIFCLRQVVRETMSNDLRK